jgi:hypothetical protein
VRIPGKSRYRESLLCSIKHHVKKSYGRKEVLLYKLGRGEWSAPRVACFTLGEMIPDTHGTGVWVGTWAGLKDVRMIRLCPCRKSNTNSPVVQPAAKLLHWLGYPFSWIARNSRKSQNLTGPSKPGTILFGAIATNSWNNAPINFVVSVRCTAHQTCIKYYAV